MKCRQNKSNLLSAKLAVAIIVICAFVFPGVTTNLALAGLVSFQKGYAYQASEYDSKVSCRALALEQVKRLLLEELGTYLESETEVKNFQLTKDQIVILTAGIVSTEVLEEKWDGKTYYLKAKITADPKDVANSIEKLRQDRQKIKELEELRRKADEALREVEKLKKELEIEKSDKTKFGQYNEAVNRLSATDYVNRGLAYANLGDHRQAIRDWDKAIELDPNLAMAYVYRGVAYYSLGDQWQAIRDYEKAFELDPKNAKAYSGRGMAYGKLGDYRQAIRDYDRAIELDPNLAMAYFIRGEAYGMLGDHRQAIRDYDRAIELDPKNVPLFYCFRARAYRDLGDYRQEIEDYKTAAKLGFKPAQDYLRSKRIEW